MKTYNFTLDQDQYQKKYIAYQNLINHIKLTKKKNRNIKEKEKNGNALYIFMNNAIYGKIIENLRNKTSVRPVNNEKDYSKCTSKPSHISYKIFDNN